MGRIHPVSNLVAFDNLGGSRNVAWFGDRRLYQRGADPNWETVAVGAAPPDQVLRPFGALGVKGGAFAWHTRLDINGLPTLFSSIPALDGQIGFEGAVAASADVSVTLDLEKRIAHVWTTAGKVRSITLPGGIFGESWVDQFGEWLIASCFVGPQPRLTLVRLDTGEIVTPTCLTPSGHYTPACVTVGGIVWVVYHTDEHGLVIHPASDPTKRQRLAPPPASGVGVYGVDVCLMGANVEVIWFAGQGETRPELRAVSIQTDALLALPSVPVPVVVPPPPPVEPPIVATGPFDHEGTYIDVAALFSYDGRFWPRGDKSRGDDHGMDMQMLPNGDIWYAKFDEDGQGALGEVLRVDAEHVHLRMDASGQTTVDVWPTDSRWLLVKMKIGRQFGLITPVHQLEKRKRADCSLARPSQDFSKENWIISRQMMFCGSDLGECRVTRYAYNNTGFRDGQTGHPDLWVETYYMAERWQAGLSETFGQWVAVGWIGWTSDPSSDVFKTGKAIFPAKSALTKWFARLGGRRYPPNVPGCMPPVAIPPPVVVPPPPPPPPVPPTPIQTGAAGFTQAAQEAQAALDKLGDA